VRHGTQGQTRYLLGVVTGDVNGPRDCLQLREAGDVVQLGVVRDQETAAEAGELGERDFGQRVVFINAEIAGVGEVRGREAVDNGVDKRQLATERLERRHADGTDVAEGHVHAAHQFGERDIELRRVVRQGQQTGQIGQGIDVDLGQGVVGREIELAALGHVDALEGRQAGVGDAQAADLVDALGEGQGLEVRQRLQDDGANIGQVVHSERGQQNDPLQIQLPADGAEIRRGDRRNISGTERGEVTGDLLDSAEGERTGSALVNSNATLDRCARVEGIGVTLRLDADRLGAAVARVYTIS
jgi:hypothetical protein